MLEAGPVSVERGRKIVAQLASALKAIHNAGVIHSDIKPENIVVSSPGSSEERVTIIDFGIARLKSLSENGKIGRSTGYELPEHTDELSPAADLYAFALVIFEVFEGKRPSPRQATPVEMHSLVGRRAITAIRRALDPDPAKRFADVEEFSTQVCAPARRERQFPFVMAALSVSLCGVLFVAYGWYRENTRYWYAKPRPLVASPGNEFRPAFSPDGKWLFYAAGPLDQMDIYKKAVEGGEPVKVVADPASDDEPRVSPDGSRLAFIRLFADDESAVMVRNLDSERSETELGRATEFGSLTWSEDGRFVGASQFRDSAGGTTIRVVDTKTRQWRDLVTPAPETLGDDNPTASPNGRQLAFVRKWTQHSADIFVVEVDASLGLLGAPRRVTYEQERIDSLQWTPDGRDLVYVAGPLGNGSLWRVSAAGGKRASLLSDTLHFESIAIARDRWLLAYSVHLSNSNIWRLDLDNPTKGNIKRLVGETLNDEEATYSPDASMIAFASSSSGDEQIWTARGDGSALRQITHFDSPDGVSVLWTPDARGLIISVRSKALGERIYRASATGGGALTELMNGANATSFSRDGQFLYVCRRVEQERQLWKADYPHLKTFVRVVEGEARVGQESPDGTEVYFTRRSEKEGVWRKRLLDGTTTKVIESIYRRNLFVTGRHGLFYVARLPDSEEKAGIYFSPYGRADRKLLHVSEEEIFWGLDLSRDERFLLFSKFDVNNTDIMLIPAFR
ncbi:hypothetical protein F183_A21150 [Bryobacterales bacterium F-183]|nr:hypothetical protein F183_A21150 [Bryobacterales bacterium F-183]